MDTSQDLRIVVFTLIGLALVIGVFVLSIFLLFMRKRQRHLVQMAELQQEMLRSQMEIQEQTLQTVSQELHDNIGQRLGLLKLQLNALGADVPTGPLREQVSQTIADLRQLSKSLHPERVAQQGLMGSLEEALQALQHTGAWQTSLQVEGEPIACRKEAEVILFRMVQELMNNAVKHSGGDHFTVSLHFNAQDLRITCADNGQGLPAGATRSIGFTSLHNRARLLKGTLSFATPQTGSGCEATIRIPYHHLIERSV
ncbi:MAG: histidine kinase [Chitinophagaceae bacterium]|jgi:signal transduction histidine kinase|nr:histidine kinase [Chitinophagaceae bacterium]